MSSSFAFLITDALPEHFSELQFLFLSPKTQFFGRYRKKMLLEDIFFKTYTTYRIVMQISEKNPTFIGYAEVSNGPNLPALADDLWLNFLDFHYCCNLPFNTINTCFLNTFVYNNDYNPDLLRQLLGEIFYRENKLKYILILECPDYRRYPKMYHPNYNCLEVVSTVFYPKCFSAITCTNTQKLHVIMRDNLLPKMRYRKALPEDNDDIVDIADYDRPDLKQELGEYYIAEQLLSESKSQLIVTEINNVTAGFIWLSDNVNLLPLLENYNLQSFGNLVKFNVKERFKEKIIYVTTAQKHPLELLFTTETVNQIYKYVGEVTNIENVSNLSLCSHHIESHEGRIVAVNEKSFVRELALKKWQELNEKIKSYDYYVQIRRRQFGFYYNIPEGQRHAPCDSNLNAFVIELFGLMSPHDPRRVFRFLMTAFAAYPDKDYCLLSINVVNRITPTLYEILKYFVRVARRPGCLIDEHLFITHRSAVYGDISLYPVQKDDVEPIKSLIRQESSKTYHFARRAPHSRLSTIADRVSFKSILSDLSDSNVELTTNQYDLNHVLDILNNIFEDPYSKYQCFTIKCGDASRSRKDNILVGFVIIRPFYLSCYLKKHFHIYKEHEFQNFLKAEVVILKLNPFFHFQSDFIYRELSRQTSYRYFYYFRPTDHYYLSNDLVANMQPLEPRRVKKIWFNYLDKNHSTSKESRDKYGLKIDLLEDKFAVFVNNLRTSENFGNHRNIVILGFNDICKAFLRLIIFSWHNLSDSHLASINCLPLLNITVVCSPGIVEADHENAFQCKTCSAGTCWIDFKNSDAFIADVYERMDLRTWIKFVNGKVETIDTEHQFLTMQSGCEIFYETLLLMCGTDFGVPERIFGHNAPPPNYCHINNRFDKIVFYHKLQILLNDLPRNITKSIIVYGCHIKAFEFINFLLKHGIQGSEIHFVMPYTMENRQMGLTLNNSSEDLRIEEILREMLEDLGVKIYDQLNLYAYTLHDDEKNLREVSFKKFVGGEVVTMECDLFVSYYEVFVANPLLEIFKKSDINTMGNFVLVDENYETTVANIYAMGNFIKHFIEPNHQYRFVSHREAAEKIINSLGLNENINNTTTVEKKFSKTSYFQAQLPMDYLFVKVTSPKRYLANHLDNEYGFPLVTYNEGEFSRVRLNEHGMVEEIVFVTKRKLNFDFLKFFCGRHESLLNNLKSRWYLKEIINFIDFFQEPWTELLMHDQFESLRAVNKALIKDTAEEMLKKKIDREARHKLLNTFGKAIGLNTQIQYAFTEFLRSHREDFQTNIALPEDFPQNH